MLVLIRSVLGHNEKLSLASWAVPWQSRESQSPPQLQQGFPFRVLQDHPLSLVFSPLNLKKKFIRN